MAGHLERAMLLVEQSRFELAERELHLVLADQPSHSMAHSLLALCLVERQAYRAATESAQTAIGCSPDEPFPYYTLARVLFARNEFEQSASAIQQALALDPFQPEFHSQLAAVRLEQRRWSDALEAAERGLTLEPDDVGCANLRAIALVRLGRRIEAESALNTALAHDPNNALSHANVGWTMLEARQYEQALVHFREALRLDAECEWARMGIVEALKARHLIYGWLLSYFLWTSRLSRMTHVAIVVIGLVVLNLANLGLQMLPGGTAAAIGLIVLYGLFAYLTWAGDPLFNLVLRFDKLGRHALNDDERRTSSQVGLCLGLTAVSLALWPATGSWAAPAGAAMFAVLVIPVAGASRCPDGWPREAMEAYTLGLALLAAVATGLLATNEESFAWMLGACLFLGYCLGVVLSTWLASGLASVRVRR